MKIETIRKNHKKQIIVGIVAFLIIAIVLIVGKSFAKYNLVKNIKMAEGTINYKVPDFKMMAMYKNDGNGDIEINTMPESGYIINESKSYCTLDNVNKDLKAKLFTNEDGKHVISGLSKSSKCYLYFDKVKTAGETILANVTVKSGTPDFSKVATTDEGVFKTKDDDSDTYYFRGAVNNNYIRFAGFWWRIIRINGDGSIRLIYDGTESHANGTSTSDNIAVSNVKWSHKDAYYNTSTDHAYVNDNMYAGFKYASGQLHGLETKSNALIELEKWYQNNLASYAAKIDTNAGFCGDRTPSANSMSINNQGGTGTITTYYAGYIRLVNDVKTPVLSCANSSDLYTISNSAKGNKSLTYPIGLITADEVSMAGAVWGTTNQNYYLYNSQNYWSLSPYCFDGLYTSEFYVYSTGHLGVAVVHDTAVGLRPVINLRPDVALSGTGTMADPYVVK